MAKYRITGPDGNSYVITAPDTASQDEVMAYAKQNWQQAPKAQPTGGYDASGKPVSMEHPGAPKDDIYTAQAKKQPWYENAWDAFGGLAYGLTHGKGMSPEQAKDWKDSMAGLNATAGGQLGTLGGSAALAAPLMMAPGANTVPGAMAYSALYGAAQPSESTGETIGNAVLNAAGGAGGQLLGRLFMNKSATPSGVAAGIAKRKADNQVRDATIKLAQDNGLVLTPSMVGKPSILEGIGGQFKTQQAASWRNQPVLNDMARTEFGLTEGTPLTADTMKAVRDQAAAPYAEVAGLPVKPSVTARSGFVDWESPVQAESGFNAGEALERLKQLRHDGHEALAAWKSTGNPELRTQAKAALENADAIEGQIEQYAIERGRPDLVDRLRASRQTIAKSYSLQDALRNSTGDIQPRELGVQYEEGMSGLGPRLTGNLEKIGRFASAFDEAARMRSFAPLTNSPLDTATAVIAGTGAGTPAGFMASGIPLLREPIRKMLMSPKYQAGMMPRYKPTLGQLMMTNPDDAEIAQLASRVIPVSALLSNRSK